MSFSKGNKPAESKETTTASKAAEEEPGKVDVKALREELEGKTDDKGKKTGGRDITFSAFANGDENFRKRVLKEHYSELKSKYGWLYDQPIKANQEEK